jgi:hypothetical protein
MKFTNTSRTRRAVALGAGSLTALAGLSVWGVNAAQADSSTPIDIVLGVGSTQTEKIVSWYAPTGNQQAIQISEGASFDAAKAKTVVAASAPNTAPDTETAAAAKKDDGTAESLTAQTGYYNAHVALHDLKAATQYTYRVGSSDGSGWSSTYTFSTGSADQNAFTFAAFGDPQIGSSGYTHLDGRGWAATLDYIATNAPQTELLVSTGDQVEHANNEYDWSNWADPDRSASGGTRDVSPVLKQFTYAAQIGNHEGAYSDTVNGVTTPSGRAYNQHFAVPNEDTNALFTRTSDGGTTANRPGGNYWYKYKNVLFINVNSNAYADQAGGNADAAHAAYIKQIVEQHGAGTKWQVVTFHHAIYSPADHANDADNSQRRKDLTYTMSQEGIDLVIQGHDHAYSRSYELKSTAAGTAPGKANAAEQPGSKAVVTGPGGVIYVTADSASGSKYYDLTAPDTSKNGGDYGPDSLAGKNDANQTRHWANSVESQTYTPTFVQVTVSADKLTVKNIASQNWNADTNAAVKTNKAGQRIKTPASVNPSTGATTAAVPFGDAELASLGDQRPEFAADPHHLQTAGALSDEFTLSGGNSNAFPDSGVVTVPGATVTVTASPSAAPTSTVTVTAQPQPAQTVTVTAHPAPTNPIAISNKIASLKKQIRHAKGAKKAKLQGQLAAYQAIQKKLD